MDTNSEEEVPIMMRMTSFHISSPLAEGSNGKEKEESHDNVFREEMPKCHR
jgi:hypothetical protein